MIKIGQIYEEKISITRFEVIEIVNKVLYRFKTLNGPSKGVINNLYKEEIANDFDLLIGTPLDSAMDKVAVMFDSDDMSSKLDHKGNWIPKKQWDKLYCSCSEKEEKVINIEGNILVVCLTCHKEIIK